LGADFFSASEIPPRRDRAATMRNAMHAYQNPWHKPGKPHYGPATYETDAVPEEYRGHLIFERIPGRCWDVVKDGACLTQLAGPNGARRAVDALCEGRA
jgi:hypothetical protein